MAIWYPGPKALDDLTVTETEDGFEFSAPAGSECATWLGYYNSSEELQQEFSAEIISAIEIRLQELETHGGQEQNLERVEANRA